MKITRSQLRKRLIKLIKESKYMAAGGLVITPGSPENIDKIVDNHYKEINYGKISQLTNAFQQAARSAATGFGQMAEEVGADLMQNLFARGYSFAQINRAQTIGSGIHQMQIGTKNFQFADIVAYPQSGKIFKYHPRFKSDGVTLEENPETLDINLTLISAKCTMATRTDSATRNPDGSIKYFANNVTYSNLKTGAIGVAIESALASNYVQNVLNDGNLIKAIRIRVGAFGGSPFSYKPDPGNSIDVNDITDLNEIFRYKFVLCMPPDDTYNFIVSLDGGNTAVVADDLQIVNQNKALGTKPRSQTGAFGDLEKRNLKEKLNSIDDALSNRGSIPTAWSSIVGNKAQRETAEFTEQKYLEAIFQEAVINALPAKATLASGNGSPPSDITPVFSLNQVNKSIIEKNSGIYTGLRDLLKRYFYERTLANGFTYSTYRTHGRSTQRQGNAHRRGRIANPASGNTSGGTVSGYDNTFMKINRTSYMKIGSTFGYYSLSIPNQTDISNRITAFSNDLKAFVNSGNSEESEQKRIKIYRILLSSLGENLSQLTQITTKFGASNTEIFDFFENAIQDFKSELIPVSPTVNPSAASPINASNFNSTSYDLLDGNGAIKDPSGYGDSGTVESVLSALSPIDAYYYNCKFRHNHVELRDHQVECIQRTGVSIGNTSMENFTYTAPAESKPERRYSTKTAPMRKPTSAAREIKDFIVKLKETIQITRKMTQTSEGRGISDFLNTILNYGEETADIFFEIIGISGKREYGSKTKISKDRKKFLMLLFQTEKQQKHTRKKKKGPFKNLSEQRIELAKGIALTIRQAQSNAELQAYLGDTNIHEYDLESLLDTIVGLATRFINESLEFNEGFNEFEALVIDSFKCELINIVTLEKKPGSYLKPLKGFLSKIQLEFNNLEDVFSEPDIHTNLNDLTKGDDPSTVEIETNFKDNTDLKHSIVKKYGKLPLGEPIKDFDDNFILPTGNASQLTNQYAMTALEENKVYERILKVLLKHSK